MPTLIFETDDPDGSEPCPMTCGNLTEDPYGGPCQACIDALYEEEEEERQTSPIGEDKDELGYWDY